MRTDTEHKTRMRLVALAAALLALAGFALAVGSAARAYVPKHGKACHRGYAAKHKTVKRHGHKRRVRVCVKRPSSATVPAGIKLHAHLDPTHSRDPRDPFKVTYRFGASASRSSTGGGAQASTVEDPPLPSGVLSLFSDGVLYCAVNVGGQAVGDECPVEYAELGQHRVTSVYTSGEDSSTVTEIQTIEPLPTTTSLTAGFTPHTPHEVSAETYDVGELTASTSGTLDGGPAPGPVLARWEGEWRVSVGGGPFTVPSAVTVHATTHPPAGYTQSDATAQVTVDPTFPMRAALDEVTVTPEDGPTAVAVEPYTKATGPGTALALRAAFSRLGIAAGCVVTLRLDGESTPGDEGREATGSVIQEVHLFPDLEAGPVTVEAVVEATEGEPCQVVGALYASE